MEEKPRTKFQQKCASLSDRTWDILQIIVGVLVGAAVVFCLFFGGKDDDGPISYSLILVVALALVLPRSLEHECDRPILRGRIAMCIAMGVGIAVCALLMWLKPEIFQ